MYTDEQKRRHIYDLQVCLRRIQQENDHPQPLVPDGIFGAETAEAVRAHQRQNGLPVSGQVDRATWDSIFGAYEQLTALDALPAAVRFFPAEGGVLSPATGARRCLSFSSCSAAARRTSQISLPSPSPANMTRRPRPLCASCRAFSACPPTGVADCATWDMLAGLHNALYERAPLAWALP